jgi:hypothetical protein
VSGNTFLPVFASPIHTSIPKHLRSQYTDIRAVNDERTARVADLLSDFRNLQYYIAGAPVDPGHSDDYYTEGHAVLRQCYLDGQHILNCAADTRVPRTRGGPEEQAKAELQQ